MRVGRGSTFQFNLCKCSHSFKSCQRQQADFERRDRKSPPRFISARAASGCKTKRARNLVSMIAYKKVTSFVSIKETKFRAGVAQLFTVSFDTAMSYDMGALILARPRMYRKELKFKSVYRNNTRV